jgi:catechol 2,3-dioxygenase-like lactoylglutathione lyase family enzyme
VIDHVCLPVKDLSASRAFYDRALAPLGFTYSFGEEEGFCAYRLKEGLFEFYVEKGNFVPVHLAFRAKNRAEVDAFHLEALAAGAEDNGAPGFRPKYAENYYAAFVLDPDGHNIEAVSYE